MAKVIVSIRANPGSQKPETDLHMIGLMANAPWTVLAI